MSFEKNNYQVSSSLLIGISLVLLLIYYVFSIHLFYSHSDEINDEYSWYFPLVKELFILKITASLFLVLGVFSAKVRKDYNGKALWFIAMALGGFLVYFSSDLGAFLGFYPNKYTYVLTLLGYLIIGSSLLVSRRILKYNIDNDVFNTFNESFIQEDRKIVTEDSLNIPTHYLYKGRRRTG